MMIVRIDGKILEIIKITVPEKRIRDYYNYSVPNLQEDPTNTLDAIDKFNYGLLSKTETGDFLYRQFRGVADFYFREVPNAIVEVAKDDYEFIQQAFLWWS